MLTATLRDGATNDDIHTSSPVAIYRSEHSATAIVNTGAALHVDPESSPPFTKFTSTTSATPSATGTIGYVNIAGNTKLLNIGGTTAFTAGTDGQVVGTNLVAVDTSEVVSAATVAVTHPALGDDAFSEVNFRGSKVPDSTTTPPKTIQDGVATFSVSEGDFEDDPPTRPTPTTGMPIMLKFDGSSRISSSGAGSATVTFKDTASDALSVPPGTTGALANITRGGLNVHLNGVRNSVGNGADLYVSVVRIMNNGVVSGSVDVSVYDTSNGDMLGEFSSSIVSPGEMIQWTSAQKESAAGIDPGEIALYALKIEGAITGYVQHLNWNSVDNLFSDLSGFRNGQLSGAP